MEPTAALWAKSRPSVEAFERRILLSSVTVSVFNDPNQNGTGTSPLNGRQVFVDLNGNGLLDAGEPTSVTGTDGTATLSLDQATTASVQIGELLPPGVGQTTPATQESIMTVAAPTAVRFGNLTLSPSPSATGSLFKQYTLANISTGSPGANPSVVQPDGKIVVAGEGSSGAIIARFFPDGQPDLNFGTGGSSPIYLDPPSQPDENNEPFNMVLGPQNSILVSMSHTDSVVGYVYIAQFGPDGTKEGSFSAPPEGDNFANPTGLIANANGSVIVGVDWEPLGNPDNVYTIYDLNPDNSLVSTFGTNGEVDVDQIVDGPIADPSTGGFVVVCTTGIEFYSPGGVLTQTLPISGTAGGTLTLPSGETITRFTAERLAFDGDKILLTSVASTDVSGSGGQNFTVLERLNHNGTLDTTFGGGANVGGLPGFVLQDTSDAPTDYGYDPSDIVVLPSGAIAVTYNDDTVDTAGYVTTYFAQSFVQEFSSAGVPSIGYNTSSQILLRTTTTHYYLPGLFSRWADASVAVDTPAIPLTVLLGSQLAQLDTEATAPTASLQTPTTVTAAGPRSESLYVEYADPVSIQPDTLGYDNLTVTRPDGSTAAATYLGIVSGTAQDLIAQYVVPPPGGSWTAADDGTYTVAMNGGQVSNGSVAVSAGTLGSFAVNVGPAPTATLAAVSPVTTNAATVELPVTYAGSTAPILASSIDAGDVSIAGPAGTLMVTSVTTIVSGLSVTAVYTVAAPAGGFMAADDGTYTIAMVGGQVRDQAGGAVDGGTLGTFDVSIPRSTSAAASVVTVAASGSTAKAGTLVTFTATVSGAGATPTGTVAFYDGATLLGAAPIVGGAATLATAALSPGGNLVTADYGGDADFGSSTSSAVRVDIAGPVAGEPALAPAIGRLVLPSVLVAGVNHKLAVPLTITNTGGAVERGTVRVNVYAAPGTMLDSSAVLVASIPYRVSIKNGRAARLFVRVAKLPSTVPAGTYHLLTQVIDADGFAESTATSQTVTVVAPTVVPSLSISKVPASLVAGARTAAAVVLNLANNGTVPITGVVTVTVSIVSQAPTAAAIRVAVLSFRADIPPGRSKRIAIPLRQIPLGLSGLYQVLATVNTPPTTTGAAAASADAGPADPVAISA